MTAGDRPVLITGGAGFIGCNLASHLARSGHRVRVLDDLSRAGVDRNLVWLQRTFPERIEAIVADVRDCDRVREAVNGAQAVFHLAAQVGVTTSLADPRLDFDLNARATIDVLEAVKTQPKPPPLIFASTSKVYGSMPDQPLRVDGERWSPLDDRLRMCGIDESRPLEFRTPYGCSKGCADQYVLDYAHSFEIPAVVFRMSCVYGPHQLGTESQAWVAHFLRRAIAGEPITIYGDGKQVRDVLFVDDLVDAFVRAWSRIGALAGRAFNIGGGPAHAISLAELIRMIEELRGHRPEVRHEAWRQGDQRYYVSNVAAFSEASAWRARIAPRAGIEALHGWLLANGARHG
jgi:CDP-paratose 2-epimerase